MSTTAPELPPADPSGNSTVEEPAAEPLTAEEQMARYEAALKESDWGHQPC